MLFYLKVKTKADYLKLFNNKNWQKRLLKVLKLQQLVASPQNWSGHELMEEFCAAVAAAAAAAASFCPSSKAAWIQS